MQGMEGRPQGPSVGMCLQPMLWAAQLCHPAPRASASPQGTGHHSPPLWPNFLQADPEWRVPALL